MTDAHVVNGVDLTKPFSMAITVDLSNGHRAGAAASLRASLSAYAPPPRKVEVTPEVVNVYLTARGLDKSAYDSMELAIEQANFQAGAREAEEIARLKGEVERLEAKVIHLKGCSETATGHAVKCAEQRHELRNEIERLTKERDDWQAKAAQEPEQGNALISDFRQEIDALRAHADKLEAMLTVEGVGGKKVKLWLPFEAFYDGKWTPAETHPEDIWVEAGRGSGRVCSFKVRQSPAPAAEPLKRWRIKPSNEDAIDTIITKPMTRADAEAIGKVIGEAGE